jgi:sugar phosphate permease
MPDLPFSRAGQACTTLAQGFSGGPAYIPGSFVAQPILAKYIGNRGMLLSMKIFLLLVALAAFALYLLTENRKIEFELEIEPKDGRDEE